MSESSPTPVLLDRLQRPLRDLRISVTDRCNFRCTYCMPREVFGPGYEFLHRADLLRFEEIVRLASLFATLGTRKIRLTGGEPLLRRGLSGLIAQLRTAVPQAELTLTTNGSLLRRQAAALKEAGLSRLTVSLDALDDLSFQRMNDAGVPVSQVLDGIQAAVEAGFSPVKINAVIRRGVNEHAIADLAEHFSGPDFIVRFIEYMDVGSTNGWRLEDVVPARTMATLLEASAAGRLAPLPPAYTGEVARRYRTAAGGEIGVISSVTQPFCRHCHRARLSSDGRLFTCLFGSEGLDLRGPLRDGTTDSGLTALITRAWTARNDRYSELRSPATPAGSSPGSSPSPPARSKVEMSAIGG